MSARRPWLACIAGLAAVLPLHAQGDEAALDRHAAELKQGGDARDRRKAVQALAALDHPRALELVLELGLKDADAMVADEAQLALAGMTGGDVLEAFAGKLGLRAKGDLLRRRAAWIAGQLEVEFDAAPLVRLLSEREPSLRRAALASLESLARRDQLTGDLDKARAALAKVVQRDKDDELRAAGLLALAALAPDEARALATELLADDAPAALRAGAVLALGSTDAAVEALDDDALCVRLVAVDGIVERPSRAGVLALTARLGREPELRGRWAIVDALRRLTGRKDGLAPEPWGAFADGLAVDWSPPMPPPHEPELRPGGELPADERTVAFAGLPIRSERVLFLIDQSGSLWMDRAGNKTRKELLDEELARALGGLSDTTHFNLVPYTAEPHPWKKQLTPASATNVKRALDDFERNKQSGPGDFWEAFLAAYEDEDVDTLVILTDGAPSGGEHWNLDLIQDLVLERNRFRRLCLDVVLIDASQALVGRWRNMSAASGGRLVRYSL